MLALGNSIRLLEGKVAGRTRDREMDAVSGRSTHTRQALRTNRCAVMRGRHFELAYCCDAIEVGCTDGHGIGYAHWLGHALAHAFRRSVGGTAGAKCAST